MVLADSPAAPQTAGATRTELAAILKALAERQEQYRTADAYYTGQHSLRFATTKFSQAFGTLFRAFADNLCAPVVDAVADRLQLTGFDQEATPRQAQGQPAPRTAADQAWAIWRQARLPRLAGQIHQEALAAGDAYLIVWPGPGGDKQPVFYPQCGRSMTVTYNPEVPGQIERAAKWWLTEDRHARLTLYYPDRIEKYITTSTVRGGLPTNANGFTRYEVAGELWPLGNPYGQVPVFHFGNNAPIGGFGVSELRDVVPLQDALNKAIADMLVSMEFVAMPQRWATGLRVEVDPDTGKPKSPFEPGGLWAVESKEVNFGEFAQADLTHFLDVQEKFRLEIARVSRTPTHYLLMQGQMPSGESLKTAEEPFVRKVLDRQRAFGDTWEDAITFALRIGGLEKPPRLQAQWEDPAPRGEKEHLDGLQLKQDLGVSQRQLWREAGYTDDQIVKMEEEKASIEIIPTVQQ